MGTSQFDSFSSPKICKATPHAHIHDHACIHVNSCTTAAPQVEAQNVMVERSPRVCEQVPFRGP